MKIQYLKGDATSPVGESKKIIVHICNDGGAWGAGFVLALSKKWPSTEDAYRRWHKDGVHQGTPFELGRVQYVETSSPGITVVNMIAQGEYTHGVAVKYDKLEECLAEVATVASREGSSVHMPRIGCGIAGGKWEEVEPIVERTLVNKGIQVCVYDYAPGASS